MKFNQVDNTRWESEVMAVSAAMLVGENREPKAIYEPRFVILQGEHKDKTVYRLYEQHVGRKQFLKRFKSLDDAVKFASKEA